MIELEFQIDALTNRKFWKATGEDEDFKCSKCREQLTEGFVCENDLNLILCQKCQDSFNMAKCKHDKRGEHRHLKFIKETKVHTPKS